MYSVTLWLGEAAAAAATPQTPAAAASRDAANAAAAAAASAAQRTPGASKPGKTTGLAQATLKFFVTNGLYFHDPATPDNCRYEALMGITRDKKFAELADGNLVDDEGTKTIMNNKKYMKDKAVVRFRKSLMDALVEKLESLDWLERADTGFFYHKGNGLVYTSATKTGVESTKVSAIVTAVVPKRGEIYSIFCRNATAHSYDVHCVYTGAKCSYAKMEIKIDTVNVGGNMFGGGNEVPFWKVATCDVHSPTHLCVEKINADFFNAESTTGETITTIVNGIPNTTTWLRNGEKWDSEEPIAFDDQAADLAATLAKFTGKDASREGLNAWLRSIYYDKKPGVPKVANLKKLFTKAGSSFEPARDSSAETAPGAPKGIVNRLKSPFKSFALNRVSLLDLMRLRSKYESKPKPP